MSRQEKLTKLLKLSKIAQIVSEAEESGREQEKKRRIWVREWVGRRKEEAPLLVEVQNEDPEKFFSDFRLYPEDFEKLLTRYYQREVLEFEHTKLL